MHIFNRPTYIHTYIHHTNKLYLCRSTYILIYTDLCTYIYRSVYLYIQICVLIYTDLCTYVHRWSWRAVNLRMYVCVYVQTHIHTCIYVCACVCMDVCMHVCISRFTLQAYMCSCIYLCMHVCMDGESICVNKPAFFVYIHA